MKPVTEAQERATRAAMAPDGCRQVEKEEWRRGQVTIAVDWVVNEVPVALVYNGISHVVMMATPTELEDFALGFSLSEGILTSAADLLDMEIVEQERGIELQLTIVNSRFELLKHKRRNLAGRTGCGLCGAESLDQAMAPVPQLTNHARISHAALNRAVAQLLDHQPLQARTGASHGAAWCDEAGKILLVREDVGRHNALDKLLGALQRRSSASGFVLVTSRASYEMVAKTAHLNIPLLASVSAPTALAIATAKRCGMTLVGFTQPGRHVVYSGLLAE